MDLFKPVVTEDKFHHNFLATIKPNATGVRQVLSGWADGFADRDGKFVAEFQTTYNSSFWELYLFAVLKHLGIKVDFSYEAPDFVAADHPLAIEAAIASHAQDDVPEWEKSFAGITDMNVEAAQLQSTIRLSNALMGKSEAFKKRYASLPHLAGRAYVVAIANYGRQDFNFLGDVAMQRLLFDPENKKQVLKANRSAVPLGLFNADGYAHISAVMFSSVATFGKTRALGRHEGEFVFYATRIRNNAEPIRIVARNAEYKESLTDGLKLYTNPYATIPVDVTLFEDPGIWRYVAKKDGTYVVSSHPDGDLSMRMVHAIFAQGGDLAARFRTVRHTYNDSGKLAERAVLCGRYELRTDALAAVEAQVAHSSPSGYEKAGDRWWITDKEGKVHWLLIESVLA